MVKFEIVEGPMRAGKTTYAKAKEKLGYIYFSHDDMVGTDFQQLWDRVVKSLKENPGKDAIIDGWFSIYNKDCTSSVLNLIKNVPHHVVVTIIFNSFDVIYSRRATCGVPFERIDIAKNLKKMVDLYRNLKDVEFVFLDASKNYEKILFEEFMKRFRMEMLTTTEKDIDEFLAFLAIQGHDRYYQTINLPFGKSTKGYERTELTWDLVKKTIDFRGKTLLDVGSYHGFNTFGAEDCGARELTGVDACEQAINVVRRLKQIWNYESEFIHEKIEKWLLTIGNKKYDIIMCFNMIQYVPQQEDVIKRLFEIGNTIIFEAHENFKPKFDAAAGKTHRLTITQESPRWKDLRRMIYYYERI